MSSQTDYVFARVNKWIFNHGRQAAPFYIVVMLVTLAMIAFAEPLAAGISAVVGMVIIGWRDIDTVSRGSPEALFFRTFNEESLLRTCKYYANAMAAKGLTEDVYEVDIAMLRHFYYTKDLTWTYYMVVIMQRKTMMDFSLNKETDDPENLQQTELPAVPTSEGSTGVEGDIPRDFDLGD